jgi:hypothetical protein
VIAKDTIDAVITASVVPATVLSIATPWQRVHAFNESAVKTFREPKIPHLPRNLRWPKKKEDS